MDWWLIIASIWLCVWQTRAPVPGTDTAVNLLMNSIFVSVSDERKVECTQCDRRFFNAGELKRHMQVHTGERPHPCPYCNKRLSSPYALKGHIRIHTNETPYSCPYCPMAFKQRVSMRTHIKSRHPAANMDPPAEAEQKTEITSWLLVTVLINFKFYLTHVFVVLNATWRHFRTRISCGPILLRT